MRPYANLSRRSNVQSYLLGEGWIEVRFKDGATYRYDDVSTGRAMVTEMQNRARAGQGLNSYITRVVKSRYAAKW